MARLVALDLPTPVATLAALDGVWAAGDAALVLPAGQPAPDRTATLERLRPTALRTADGEQQLPSGWPVHDGTAVVVATSGSTGTPTGVLLSHTALGAMVTSSRARLRAADGVPWLGVLPLHHVAGLAVVLRSRAAGREPLLRPAATPQLLAAVEPAWISLVPTQLSRLLDDRADLSRHPGVLLGGAAAPAPLLARADAAGARVVTSYGSSETSGGCVYDGQPLDGVAVRLADHDDRVLVRGPVLATARRTADGDHPLVDDNGWYATADRGRWTDDGRLVVVARLDRTVVSGGENVPAGPVEELLATHPAVREVHVTGTDHPTWGQAVTAVVVATDPAAPPELVELRAHVGAQLPAAWRPTRLEVLDVLPRDPLGKITAAAVLAALDARGN